MDASHIRWHQAGVAETESNGFALCALHHKTSDLDAFFVDEGVLLVSDQVEGATGFQKTVTAFHGKPIREAQRPEWRPESQHRDWHRREIFHGERCYRG